MCWWFWIIPKHMYIHAWVNKISPTYPIPDPEEPASSGNLEAATKQKDVGKEYVYTNFMLICLFSHVNWCIHMYIRVRTTVCENTNALWPPCYMCVLLLLRVWFAFRLQSCIVVFMWSLWVILFYYYIGIKLITCIPGRYRNQLNQPHWYYGKGTVYASVVSFNWHIYILYVQ